MSSIETRTPQGSTFFIISSFAYLPNAEVALGQIKIYHPSVKLIIFITERNVDQYICPIPNVDVVSIFDIGIHDIDMIALSYNILEFNTAVKPFCFLYLMKIKNFDKVIYIDSDIYIVSPLEEVFTILSSGLEQIVLTPHTLSPIEDADFPSDSHFLQSGVFNLGFLAIRNGEDSLSFIAWWARKTRFFCKIDVKNGIFTDQKWCDLVPCLFAGVHILRHAGYNVAYWNLMHRFVTRDSRGKLLSGGVPLRFFHFSQLPIQYNNILCPIQTRIKIDHLSAEAQQVIKSYRMALVEAKALERSFIPSDYGAIEYFGDEHILSGLKTVYERYVTEPEYSFALFIANCAISNHAVSALGISSTGCTDIVMACYEVRPDLQAAFPKTDAGMHTLLHWVSLHFSESYTVKSRIGNSIDRYLKLTGFFIFNQSLDDKLLSPLIREVIDDTRNKDSERFWRILKGLASDFSPILVDSSHNIKIPEIFLILWEERLDLRMAFDIHQEIGARGFIEWLYYRLQNEYGHSAWISDLLEAMFINPNNWGNMIDRSLFERSNAINKDKILTAAMREIENYGHVAKENYEIFSLYEFNRPSGREPFTISVESED